MRATRMLALMTGALFLASSIQAQERVWDQKKAEKLVKGVLAKEKTGQPWDTIPWMTNADKAAARAKKENKPIFLYFYLKKPVGPKAAPG